MVSYFFDQQIDPLPVVARGEQEPRGQYLRRVSVLERVSQVLERRVLKGLESRWEEGESKGRETESRWRNEVVPLHLGTMKPTFDSEYSDDGVVASLGVEQERKRGFP